MEALHESRILKHTLERITTMRCTKRNSKLDNNWKWCVVPARQSLVAVWRRYQAAKPPVASDSDDYNDDEDDAEKRKYFLYILYIYVLPKRWEFGDITYNIARVYNDFMCEWRALGVYYADALCVRIQG